MRIFHGIFNVATNLYSWNNIGILYLFLVREIFVDVRVVEDGLAFAANDKELWP